jgi:hypothetical protein
LLLRSGDGLRIDPLLYATSFLPLDFELLEQWFGAWFGATRVATLARLGARRDLR